MLSVLYVAVGGAIGAVLRFGLLRWMPPPADGLPLATILANVIGCLLIGLLAGLFSGPLQGRDELRALLVVGVLGALTTFSTYGWETYALGARGHLGLAAVNLLLSNLAGLAAIWLGQTVAARWA